MTLDSVPVRFFFTPIATVRLTALLVLVLAPHTLTFAQSVEAFGDVRPYPSPNPTNYLASASFVAVGDSTTGHLSILNGGIVEDQAGFIGNQPGSIGSAIVTGANSRWTNSYLFIVGFSGDGTLTIADGATVTNTGGYIAYYPGSTGIVTVSGTGTSWLNSDILSIGHNGTGQLNILDGGTVKNSEGRIGDNALAQGRVTVSGAGSLWENRTDLIVGLYGTGVLNIADGGTVMNVSGYIGGFAQPPLSPPSEVTVAGAGSAWLNSDSLGVGWRGDGDLTIADGGVVAATDVTLGAEGGTGRLNLNNGGTLKTSQLSKAFGNGTVTFDGGVVQATADQDAFLSNFGAGDVISNGAGAFIDTNDFDLVSNVALSGPGGLTKVGPGSLKLTGASTYSGPTTVDQGTLIADGSIASSSMTTVQSGATLGGSGILGNTTVAAGGTLAPGNSIGTLTVTGDLTFAQGSRFEVEVAPSGTKSDLIAVTGKATIKGGTVAHIGMSGTYDPTATYTILRAAGGLSAGSAFDAVTSDFAFLHAKLGYEANEITLRLKRNDVGFGDVGTTPNQIATARALDSLGFGNTLYNAVVQLDQPMAVTAFDQLSGEIHGSALTGLIEGSRHVPNAANDRMRAAFGDVGASMIPVMAYGPNGPAVSPTDTDYSGMIGWGQTYGALGTTVGDANATGIDRAIGGAILGLDAPVNNQARLGVLAGYSRSGVTVDGGDAAASMNSYDLGLYGGTKWQTSEGDLLLRGGLAYSWYEIGTSRVANFTGFADGLTAHYDASALQAFGELAYGIDTKVARIEPFGSLAHVKVMTNGFVESGGAARLLGQDGSNSVTFSTLGVRAETELDLGNVTARLSGMLGWRHTLGDTTPKSTQAFAGSDAFTIAGAPIAQDAALIEAGLDLDLAPNVNFGLSYKGQLASSAQDHGFAARLGVQF